MKTLTTLAALLIAGASVYANVGNNNPLEPKKKVAIVQNVQAKYKLVYLNENKGNVKIDIVNEEGKVVHHQTVANENGFAQQFDFSPLPEGKYTFEITHPDGTKMSKEVEYKKHIASSDMRAGVLDINGNKKFRLAVIKNDAPVEVKIFDDKNNLLYEDVVHSTEGFRKVYDMKDIEATSFKFEVSSNNNTVTLFTE